MGGPACKKGETTDRQAPRPWALPHPQITPSDTSGDAPAADKGATIGSTTWRGQRQEFHGSLTPKLMLFPKVLALLGKNSRGGCVDVVV